MRANCFVAAFLLAVVSISAFGVTPKPASILETSDQQAVETLAFSLLKDPAIQSARAAAITRYQATRWYQTADGRSHLQGAVDELLWGVLLSAASDPAEPKIVWTETLPRKVGKRELPGSRYAGDSPDRIYRGVTIDPAYRYEIRGRQTAQKNRQPLYISIEAIPRPAFWGLPPAAVITSKDIDVAADGSFTIIVDSSPTEGRRNHLQLPPQAAMLLLRDTTPNWRAHANALSIRRVDDVPAKPRSRDDIIRQAVALLEESVTASMKYFEGISSRPTNELNTFVRDLGWGILAVNNFSIADDEALLITLDPVSARYLSLQVMDAWLRSVPYRNRTTAMNDTQAQANADGSFTYVLSKRDPGVYNWIDSGLNDGIMVVRWELLTQKADAGKAVRECRKLKLAELDAALAAEVKRVTPAERKQQLAQRQADYESRLKQQVDAGSGDALMTSGSPASAH